MFSENDIKKYVPNIIDAYCQLFGEEYREIISKRANNLKYFIYYDSDTLENYYDFLLTCKQKELSVKFLNLIGVDTGKNKNFADDLDTELDNLIDNYIGGYKFGLGLFGHGNYYGVLSFRPENINYKENRVKFLNFLLQSSNSIITVDTLDEFYKTEEFKKMKDKIKLCIDAYDEILSEYEEYKTFIEPYKKSIFYEETLRDDIFKAKENEFLKKTYSMLPLRIKLQMHKQKINISDLFNDCNLLEEKSNIEYFSKTDNAKLQASTTDEFSIKYIKHSRKQYFSSLGIDLHLDLDSYEEIINNSNVRRLIPSERIVEDIIKLKSQKLMEAQKIYYSLKNNKNTEKYPVSSETIYSNIQNNKICITHTLPHDFSRTDSTLFFTFRSDEGGMLDYIILHEFCHTIETSICDKKLSTGFDITALEHNIGSNPYDKTKKKYECLNENITDIFAMLSLISMRKKNFYMLDLQSQTASIEKIETHNTFPLTKRLLMPFISKYMNKIVKARILGDFDELFAQIGQENFEDLNDTINKLNYLLDFSGFSNVIDISKIDLENCSDADLLEIVNQVRRVEQIYINMNNYKNNLNELHTSTNEDTLKESLDYTDMEIE